MTNIVKLPRDRTWQYRATAYLQGKKTHLGAVLLAVMGKMTNPPCYHAFKGAVITKEGQVLALYRERLTDPWAIKLVYDSVQQFTDIFRGLADELQLDDSEREAMFAELRLWIRHDFRVKTVLFD